ncbi:MAG TPA: SDR family oxidoreductase [Pirellulaceae bacterium]|nr:SDR family oxidoreductase [Pirellulaceae bacterium]
MTSLSGKNVLITGGATGIGWGIAHAFAQAGANVAISGRREDKLLEATTSWKGPNKILAHTVNVAERASVQALFAWADEELGKIDILVCSAGMNIKNRMLSEMLPEQWDEVLAVNATGVYNCLYQVLPQMRARQDGLIFIVSSISGKRAAPLGGVAYNASKFAATGLGTSAWSEEAPNGIRITNIYPGEVDTPILEHRPQPVSAERRSTMLRPDDVAAMVIAVSQLPPHAHVPELIIKPTVQAYV